MVLLMKMMKKLTCLVIAALMLVSGMLLAYADEKTVLRFGKVCVYMPEITAEIYGSGYSPESISAMLGQEQLEIRSTAKFDSQKDTVCAYILIDLSTSMSNTFDMVKNCITSYINGMNENDRLIVITFGEEVETVANGAETKEQVLEMVSKLKSNQNSTLFFEALNSAYRLATANQSSFSREYVIAFSDGADYQMGNTTYDETIKSYNTHALPLYAVCSPNTSKSAVDKFGEVARGSGGAITVLKSIETGDAFNQFISDINDITIVKMQSGSNIALGDNRQLSVRISDNQADITIPVSRSIPDNTAPVVQEIIYDKDNGVFLITFSEKVVNGGNLSSYTITDNKNKKYQAAGIKYYDGTNTAELKMQDTVYTGDYIIAFNEITDQSMQANKLTDSKTVSVEGVNPARRYLKIILITAGILVTLGLLLLLFLLWSRKNRTTDEVAAGDVIDNSGVLRINNEYDADGNAVAVKHHLKVPSMVHVSLRIKTGKASEQKIAADIASSIIVGRSDICDVYVDDTKMSRQHFVIENDNGQLMLMDLGSTNGTMLNGIKVGSRQKLNSGDKIVAGLSDIVINIV